MSSALGKKARKQLGLDRQAVKQVLAEQKFEKQYTNNGLSREEYAAAKALRRARLGSS